MHSNGQPVVFAAPRKAWRLIAAGLFMVSVVLLAVVLAASPDLDSGFGRALFIVLIPLWIVSLLGGLLACLSWFVQFRQGGSGTLAWMDVDGVHVRGGQSVAWPEVESVFTRRTESGELLLCVRPTDAAAFIARAPRERQDGMRSNLETYEAPLFINVSAFWRGTADELAAEITRLTAGRLSLAAGG
ncbi:hypothetical protein [Actinomadura chokoriensis]|uniref:hypothetical protein n=1 Tax=Actinomadura chokoriensis TaxID=454156 RepID=UPI0031F7E23A